MALINKDTIKLALTERPYLVSLQTTDRDVQSAFNDIMFAYVNRVLPNYNDETYIVYDETNYNAAVCDLTFARLIYADVMKTGYAVVRAQHQNTQMAVEQEMKKTARQYRRMGIARLEMLRALADMDENYELLPILGEEI